MYIEMINDMQMRLEFMMSSLSYAEYGASEKDSDCEYSLFDRVCTVCV